MPAPRTRFESLDALRGLAVLGMAWSGMLPDTLPAWMYHAQLPPPDHIFNDQIFGITWVDLVFPFFLFSMGAAIPLAITRRIENGQKPRSILLNLALRGLLLALFAVYGEHLRPYEWSSKPGSSAWAISVLGWVLLLLMFVRWPKSVPDKIGKGLTALGWIAATVLIGPHIYPDGKQGFENSRNDIILMVLANVAVSGGAIWLFTRCRPLWRNVIAAAVGLVFLTATAPNSLGKAIWDWTPQQYIHWQTLSYGRFLPIFYHFEYHKYLIIVLAGTFCGDIVLAAMSHDIDETSWSASRTTLIAALGVIAPILACWGLFSRQTVLTGLALAAVGIVLLLATRKPLSNIDHLLFRLARHGFALVLLGVLAEPIGGGIRKDEPTLSYFLLTAGLAFWLILSLEILFDVAKQGRWLRLATLTGMNPILGYITITNLVMGLDGLAGYSVWLASTTLGQSVWAMAFLSGGVKTLLVGLIASAFTLKKIFLRA